jgi:hypothetical protein
MRREPPEAPHAGRAERRTHTLTTVAIAVAAYAFCDLVHEVVGHGTAALMVPGVHVLSLSSVALQTTGGSRIVAAAGSMANLIAGAAALALFHRRDRFSASDYFLWLFGSLNLNGSGYPLYSGLTLVPWLVQRRTKTVVNANGVVSISGRWVAAGLVAGVCFIAIVGPGIQF